MKKALCIVLVFLLVLLTFAPIAGATAEDGTPFDGGDGSKANPFLISTGEQLAAVYSYVNENPAYCFLITKAIDMSGVAFRPIADKGLPYAGVFDGGKKSISNLTVKEDGPGWLTAMFRANEGTIKNVKLVKANIRNTSLFGSLAGGVVGWNFGTIGSCSISGSVYATGKEGYCIAGGIAAVNVRHIKSCTSSATVKTALRTYSYSGGIAALNSYDKATKKDCKISLCKNKGYVCGGTAGGVCGQNEGGYIYQSKNYAKLKASAKAYAGGISGTNIKYDGKAGRIRGCRNYQKTITAKRKGSIVGYNGVGCKVYKDNKVSKSVKTRKIGYGNRRLV